MGSKQPARDAAKRSGEPRHVCGLCDSDAGRRNLLTAFLAHGLKRGDRCVLVAPAAVQREIVDELPHRRRATEQLVVAQGHDSVDGQLAFYKNLAREARQAGRKLCLASVMSWVPSCNLQVDAMLDYERRLDVAVRRQSMRALCVYDAREFSGSDFLHAMKCHGDHARHPIVLG